MSHLPSRAGVCPAAVVATFLMLRGANAHADADFTAHPTQHRSILPPVTSTGCFLPVTKTRMLGLPKAQTDLWEAWVDARTPALIAGYEAYARSVRAYYAALEPAGRGASWEAAHYAPPALGWLSLVSVGGLLTLRRRARRVDRP